MGLRRIVRRRRRWTRVRILLLRDGFISALLFAIQFGFRVNSTKAILYVS